MNDPVINRYIAINNLLKKRFLRKPNVAEARDGFYSLGKQLVNQGNKEYAVCCYLSAANCEQQLLNNVGEINALTRAATIFLELEKEKQKLCISSDDSYLAAGVDSYNKAITKLVDGGKHELAVKLCVELGSILIDMGHIPEAEAPIQKASKLLNPGNISLQVIVLKKLSSCKIYTKDYMGALDTLEQLTSLIKITKGSSDSNSYLESVLDELETTTLLLLLITGIPHVHMKSQHLTILNKYSIVPVNVLEYTEKVELFLNLVDITLATKKQDVMTLKSIQGKVYSLFNSDQNELMIELIDKTSNIKLVLI